MLAAIFYLFYLFYTAASIFFFFANVMQHHTVEVHLCSRDGREGCVQNMSKVKKKKKKHPKEKCDFFFVVVVKFLLNFVLSGFVAANLYNQKWTAYW